MVGLLLLLSSLGAAGPGDAGPKIAPERFRGWFEAASRGRLAIPDDVSRNAAGYRFVFINGLDIGLPLGCFVQNAKELRARGVPRAAIHVLNPSSHESVAGNTAEVRRQLEAIAAKGPEKLVVIAHSRGACDAMAFALKNPEFVAERVHALFLIQGPFGGSGLADYLAGEGAEMDGQMPRGARLTAQIIGRVQSSALRPGKNQAIESLTRRSSDRFWVRLLKRQAAAIEVVAPRTFYVTSRTRPARHPLLQRAPAHYLHTYYGPNDGLVALEDQTLPGVGTVLAELDVGHTDLTHRFPSARPNQKLRRAIIDAILMAVGTAPTTSDRPSRDSTDVDADAADALEDEGG